MSHKGTVGAVFVGHHIRHRAPVRRDDARRGLTSPFIISFIRIALDITVTIASDVGYRQAAEVALVLGVSQLR